MNKFKIGDKVKLIKNSGYVAGFEIGDICKITNLSSEGKRKIEIRKGSSLGFVDEEHIEKISFFKKEFQCGDVVKIKKDITLNDLTQNHWNGCQISTMDFLKYASCDNFNSEFKVQNVDSDCISVEGRNEIIKKDIFELVKREVKEMTVEEICEALGYEVKVVK